MANTQKQGQKEQEMPREDRTNPAERREQHGGSPAETADDRARRDRKGDEAGVENVDQQDEVESELEDEPARKSPR